MSSTAPRVVMTPARRNLALVSILLSTLMGTIDTSIVNVALPQLSTDLHVAPSETVWVATAFLLAVACAVPATAALGDQVGRRRMYLVGLPIFTLASLACALAPSLGLLVTFRVVQGLGSAVILAVAIPLFRRIFPPEKLGQVLGINAMTVAIGTSAGPALGGVILAWARWPWLFLINVPVGVVAWVLAYVVVPKGQPRWGDYDTPGAVLVAAAIASFLVGLRELASPSTLPLAVGLLVVSAAFVVLFVRRERRAVRPLIPLGLFSGLFSLTVATAWASFVAQGIAFVALPFLFQSAYDVTPLHSALLFTPWPAVIVLVAPLAGRVADRVSPAYPALVGLVVLTGGLVMCALLGTAPPTWLVLVSTGVCGLGFGVFQSPNNRSMMAAAPLEHAASASAVLNTNRTVGQSTGAAVVSMALVIAGAEAGSVATQASAAMNVLWVAVAASAAAVVLSAVRLRAQLAAERFPAR
ncbi:DHA2 family efflux MFS transporter permease subunit [Luteimicrobium sp. DT211]|uniref:MFS transporter n=1 Tax=Luteimicrobium sp. DT211 TaxID=3393412 RepID=UPI003CED302F